MLDDAAKDYLSHAAQQFMAGRADGHRVVVIIDLVDGVDEHDVYALLALNAEDPTVFQVGLSTAEVNEVALPRPGQGRIDWDKDTVVDA